MVGCQAKWYARLFQKGSITRSLFPVFQMFQRYVESRIHSLDWRNFRERKGKNNSTSGFLENGGLAIFVTISQNGISQIKLLPNVHNPLVIQFVTGMANIRDVIPYPRTPRSADF